MEAFKFDIYGKYAFIKNPEINTKEFSFEHIHKPTILGLLGCILGLKGRESCTKDFPFPEYYDKLKDIKVSIVPHSVVFNKYDDTIINSTGYCNAGESQVIQREILEGVRWTIYLINDNVIDKELWDRLYMMASNHESFYPLYLGSNEYKAKISNVEKVNLDKAFDTEIVINSLFLRDIIKTRHEVTFNEDDIPYDLMLYFPHSLNELLLYNYKWYEHTNLILEINNDDNLYMDEDKVLYFI